MKNYFVKKFFRNLKMCELLTNGIVKEFLYDVYALQYFGGTSEIVLVNDDCSSTVVNDTK